MTIVRSLRLASVIIAFALLPIAVNASWAQSSTADSAALYVARARALDSANVLNAQPSTVPLWQRAVDLYRARADSLHEGEALTGLIYATNAQPRDIDTYLTKVLPMMRRAVTLFTAKGALAKAADAIEAANFRNIPNQRGEADSLAQYRRELLRLRRELGDQAGQARVFTSLSWSSRNFDSSFTYAQQSLSLARAARDTAAELFALNATGLAFMNGIGPVGGVNPRDVRLARSDSALIYFRAGVRLARKASNAFEELTDLSNIQGVFQLAGMAEPGHKDSVFHYAHEALTRSRAYHSRLRETSALVRLSNLYRCYGGADSARNYGKQAAAVARMGSDTLTLRSVLYNLASNEVDNPESALVWYRELEPITPKVGPILPLPVVWRAMAQAHIALGHRDSAIVLLRRAADSTNTNVVGGVVDRLVSLSSLGNEFLNQQQPDSALRYYREIETVARRPGGSTQALADAQIGVGRAFLMRDDLDSASSAFTAQLRAQPAALRAIPLSWLADVERRLEQFDSSLVHRRLALDGFRAQKNVAGESNQLNGLATLFRATGLIDSAVVYYRASVALRDTIRERDAIRATLSDLSGTYLDADIADSALAYGRRGLAIRDPNALSLPRGKLFNIIGLNYLQIGQLDSARIYLNRAVAIGQSTSDFGLEAAALTSLGNIALKTGAPDAATTIFRRSLALRMRTNSKASEAAGRFSVAAALSATGHPDSALVYARTAVALARTVRNRQYEGRALAQVGRAYEKLHQLDSARAYVVQAITVMRADGFARGIRTTLTEMAELYRSEGGSDNLSRATAYFDSAATVVDNARRDAGNDENGVSVSEDQLDVFGGWARAWIGRAASVGVQQSAAAALGAVERGRAQSLVDMLSKTKSANRAQSLAQFRARPGANLSAEMDSLLLPLRAAGTAALSYLHAGDTLFTWFLTPSGTLELQQPIKITETELALLVRSSRRVLGADDARSAQLDPDELNASADSVLLSRKPGDDWKRLTELLLPADLTSKVPTGTPLVIVPHGTIALVPFAALSTGPDSASVARARNKNVTPRRGAADTLTIALGVRNPLRYAPSFAALRATELRPRVTVTRNVAGAAATASTTIGTGTTAALSQALVVGNPTMPYVYSGRWTNRAQLRPLPGAEAESRAIASALGVRVLTGKAATETMVRSRMANAPLIHFATHGLAYGTSAAARRSFVAFAPDSAQDGLLTLGEIMDDQSLTLRAELVVLSACQTGLGNMKKAEGSIGLQRAFLAKGARSVLVSLWNVDDKATRLLMEKFYAYWLDPAVPRTKAKALQLAQDAVRRTPGYANPKYWAAFQLVGAE